MTAPTQDPYWPAAGPGGGLRAERHFGGRVVHCYEDRPPHLDALFRTAAARRPNAEALVGDGRRITYAALERLVDNAAGQLAQRGVAAGDRIALLLGNCPEFLVFVLAAARLGAVAVPLGTRQKGPELAYLLADCGARALVFESEFAANLPEWLPALRIVVGEPSANAEPVAALLLPAVPPPLPTIGEEDVAVILYTSGTTGRPKGAMLTHLNIVTSVINYVRCWDLGAAERSLLAVPAAHVTGLVAIQLATLYAGGSTILLREFKAREFLALAARERMTYTLVVPAIYALCLMDSEFARFDLSDWRVGGFGGAPMPEATIRALAEKLPRLTLCNAYGATETTSPITLVPPGRQLGRLDSVGRVVPGGEVRIVDESGRQMPAGEAGEVWIRGPMVVPGYWNRPDADAESFVDGFWRSGDVGALDGDGFLRVFDRLKDMINRAGYKVFSAEVENVLCEHPAVAECAVIGRADPVLGERVHAFVLPRAPDLDPEAIRRFCAARLADYKVPESVEFLAEPLPRNANGKVQKAVLRRRLADETPPPGRR